MARIKTPPGAEEDEKFEPNMTPMIDVIFQLLIFFMCTIQFKSLEGKLLSYLPKDKGQQDTQVEQIELEEITIQLSYDESTHRTIWKLGSAPCASSEELCTKIKATFDSLLSGLQREPPVKLRPDNNVPFNSIMAVLDGCRSRNIDKVEFEAPSASESP